MSESRPRRVPCRMDLRYGSAGRRAARVDMAQIVGGGVPVNDAERRVIAHLRDSAPHDWLLLHNIEVPRGEEVFEVDLLVLTGHSLCVIDVKGTRGRIEVSGTRWFPPRHGAFGSPVAKVRGTARALKGLL